MDEGKNNRKTNCSMRLMLLYMPNIYEAEMFTKGIEELLWVCNLREEYREILREKYIENYISLE